MDVQVNLNFHPGSSRSDRKPVEKKDAVAKSVKRDLLAMLDVDLIQVI